MKSEKPKLARIATMLGVSVATVSNALSGKGRVSQDLADRVRATAVQLGYVPSMAGRALRTGRSGVLGLVLPDIANPLFPQIAQAIEHAASLRGYGVLIGDSRGDPAAQTQAIARLIDRGVEGLVVIPRRGTRISEIGCPVAVVDSPSTPGNTVSADHLGGGQQMGEHLFALGHRKVMIVAGSQRSNVQLDRVAGLRLGLKGAEVDVLWTEILEEAHGANCALGLPGLVGEGYTAFATLSDLAALRALTELQGAGIAVPQQASVTGFDDLVWSTVVTPALTTMRMDMAEIAGLAVHALLSAIETPSSAPLVHGTVTALKDRVAMDLIVRASSGAAPQAPSGHRRGI